MSTNRDSGEALQKAIFDALVIAHGKGKVFDHVPEKRLDGYVAIGDIEAEEWGAKSDEDGTEVRFTVEHYASKDRGRKQVRLLQRKTYDALHHQPLTVVGSNLVLLMFEGSSADRLSDGLTYAGTSRFRALIEATE